MQLWERQIHKRINHGKDCIHHSEGCVRVLAQSIPEFMAPHKEIMDSRMYLSAAIFMSGNERVGFGDPTQASGMLLQSAADAGQHWSDSGTSNLNAKSN
jgi:hypothetical protein